MSRLRFSFCLFFCFSQFFVNACTIVAVSGRVTSDGRPMLLKNRDSSLGTQNMQIVNGQNYTYLCIFSLNYGYALSGFNEVGFSIVNSLSLNMPNSNNDWNAYIIQLALEQCATVADFEHMLDTITKPIPVTSNYGVMDALGNVAIIEVNADTYVTYNADNVDCGYLIRTNYSMSQDTTGLHLTNPSSLPRYLITSSFLEDAVSTNGYLTKEDLLGITRCMVNSEGEDLCDMAPFDENDYTPVDFRFYVPRYSSTSGMVIQGLLPGENPNLTVAWTMVGPPMTSVTVPYLITPLHVLPNKSKMGSNGHSWFSNKGHQLKNNCFVNNTTLDLAKLYNMSGTGVMQKIQSIEDEIMERGNRLVDKLRAGNASCYDIETYYSWVDGYVEEMYIENNFLEPSTNGINECDGLENNNSEMIYYDMLGRRVKEVSPDAIIKQIGNNAIIIR